MSNLREYLKEQSKNQLTESLYTSFIHKYPNKESIINLSETEIDQIMWAYDKQAQLLYNTEQFEKCFDLYQQGFKIKEDHLGCNSNYAALFSEFAKKQNNESLLKQSIQQFEKILEIKPDDIDVLDNYAATLIHISRINNDKNMLDKSLAILQKIVKTMPSNTYNLACYYSITNQNDLAKDNLFKALTYDTLPNFDHLNTDKDLDNIRKELWFIELLEHLKAKEEVDKIA